MSENDDVGPDAPKSEGDAPSDDATEAVDGAPDEDVTDGELSAEAEVELPEIEVDLEAPAEVTVGQLDALVAERDQFLDAYQRTAADFDNFRKLSQKRLSDEVARTVGGFVERMLPVLDAVDAARAHSGGDGGADDGGVEALAKALYGFLDKEGLERVDPAGEPFDPNVAEAVVHEPGEADDAGPVVTEVLRTGYLWQGRVIRPAMVKVAG